MLTRLLLPISDHYATQTTSNLITLSGIRNVLPLTAHWKTLTTSNCGLQNQFTIWFSLMAKLISPLKKKKKEKDPSCKIVKIMSKSINVNQALLRTIYYQTMQNCHKPTEILFIKFCLLVSKRTQCFLHVIN